MDIKYHCSIKGKKFYKVQKLNGIEVFLGTLGECRRFIKVHREKVRKHFSKNRLSKEDAFDLLGNEI